jgi:hypothetical protein
LFNGVFVSFYCCCCYKYVRETTQGRKDLFWLTVSEVSVHGWLALIFLGHGNREHHGERVWQSKVFYFMAARK